MKKSDQPTNRLADDKNIPNPNNNITDSEKQNQHKPTTVKEKKPGRTDKINIITKDPKEQNKQIKRLRRPETGQRCRPQIPIQRGRPKVINTTKKRPRGRPRKTN